MNNQQNGSFSQRTKISKIFFVLQILLSAALLVLLILRITDVFEDDYNIILLLLSASMFCIYFSEKTSNIPKLQKQATFSLICAVFSTVSWAIIFVISLINGW